MPDSPPTQRAPGNGNPSVRRMLCVLLRLYPISFRSELGEDLVETMLARSRESRLRFWCIEVPRLVVDGVLERIRAGPSPVELLVHAVRQLRRAPAQHVLSVFTLALGVGASAAVFTIVDAVVIRPLPYPGADSLYLVHARFASTELSSNSLSNLCDLQSWLRGFVWLGGAQDRSPALTDESGEAERVPVLDVTNEYLSGLGAHVAYGRSFHDGDFAAGAERVALVSERLWRTRWARDPAVIGDGVRLDGVPYTIVGVMAASFRDPAPIESGAITAFWLPARAGDPAFAHRDDFGFRVIGRLAGAVPPAAAQTELTAAGRRLANEYPQENRLEGNDLDFVLHRLKDVTIGNARERLLLIMGAAILLLLLACANVASLSLARGLGRKAELAVRCALGATRERIALLLLAESLLTALLAGAAGAGLAALALRAFLLHAPAGSEHWNAIPRLQEVALDERSLLFILALTCATAVVFGTLPARRGAQAAGEAATGARMTAGRRTLRAQAALVTGEICIAVVLVAVSGLLLNSLLHTLRVQPGFDGEDVIVAEVRPPVTSRSHASDLAFYGTLLERARALPGVSHAALARITPGVAGGDWSRVTPDHQQNANQSEPSRAAATGFRPGTGFYRTNVVHGDFFGALDIPLVAGRAFDDEPGAADPLVVVLNRAAARHFFPDVEIPIGRRVSLGPPGSASPMREVVGIAGDVRQQSATHEPEPQIYLPYGQYNVSRMSLVIETLPGIVISGEVIRSLVSELAPELPVDRIDRLATRYASTAEQDRFLAWLLSAFGLFGLVLSAMGTYATTSQAMSYRMRELGIRFALGARAAGVFRLILVRALGIAVFGIALGMVATLIISRFMEAHVFGITARDPLTLAAASALMALSAASAALRPALRAASLDPNAVLRLE